MKQTNELLLDDKSRFKAILNLLSEEFIDDWVDACVWNSALQKKSYIQEYAETIKQYNNHKKEYMSEFHNSVMNAAYKKLNIDFDDMVKSMFSSDFLINEIAENFRQSYKNFLTKAKKEFDNTALDTNKPEKITERTRSNKFPHKLPAGTRWEDIIIKFLDDENIFIQVKQFKHSTSYNEIGLIGKGNNPNPSQQWTFLKVLAQVNGELTIKDLESRDKYKKQKESLTKALQDYFSIDYDPFYPYHSSPEKQGNSYKIKITLIPPPDDKKQSVIEEDEDGLGIKEFLNEQAPQIFE